MARGCTVVWRSSCSAAPRRRPQRHQAPAAEQTIAPGEALYRAACVTCHGPDGKGSPRSVVGFDAPLPDFTDCAFATRRTRSRLARRRPRGRAGPRPGSAHAGVRRAPCRRDDIDAGRRPRPHVLHGARLAARRPEPAARVLHREGVSRERGGLGDSDHPRHRASRSATTLIYERRLGARNQIELVAPIDFQQRRGRSLDPRPRRRRLRVQAHALRQPRDADGSLRRARSHPADRQRGASVSATASPSSSRSRCGARCCRGTRSSRCTAASSSRPTRTRRRESCSCGPRSARRSRRTAASAAPGRRRSRCCGRGPRAARRVGRRAAAAGHAVEAPARHGRRRRRIPLTQRDERRDAGRGLPAVGLVRRRLLRVLEDERHAAILLVRPPSRGLTACCWRVALPAQAPAERQPKAAGAAGRVAAALFATRTTASPATTTCRRRPARMCRSARAGAAR